MLSDPRLQPPCPLLRVGGGAAAAFAGVGTTLMLLGWTHPEGWPPTDAVETGAHGPLELRSGLVDMLLLGAGQQKGKNGTFFLPNFKSPSTSSIDRLQALSWQGGFRSGACRLSVPGVGRRKQQILWNTRSTSPGT